MLDVACGHGRHTRWFAGRCHRVVAVDRSAPALASLADLQPRCELIHADLEGAPWPLPGRLFAAVVVTNYLWRPLLPQLVASLDEGGVLIYETFAVGNETIGKPSRPDFLLRHGELLQVCAGLRIVAYQDGFEKASAASGPRFVQRIAAVKPADRPRLNAEPPRYLLAFD